MTWTFYFLAYIFTAYGIAFGLTGKNYAEFNVAFSIGLLVYMTSRQLVKGKHVLYTIINALVSIILAIVLTGILWFIDHQIIVVISTVLLAVIFLFSVSLFFFYAYRYYVSKKVKWLFIIAYGVLILAIVAFHNFYTSNYAQVLVHLSTGLIFLTIALMLFEHGGSFFKLLDGTGKDAGEDENVRSEENDSAENGEEDGDRAKESFGENSTGETSKDDTGMREHHFEEYVYEEYHPADSFDDGHDER